MTEPVEFLQAVAQFATPDRGSGARAPRLAKIDPGYTSGPPRVTFDGESTLSGKGYSRLSSYTPTAGDRVLMIPTGSTYVIVGKVLP